MKIVEPSTTLLWITPDAERLIEAAGRTAYKSEDKITDDSHKVFIRKIIELGHESVLEHACASFRIVCNRGVSHELVRHRLASYTQESTRYCDYGGLGIQIIRPPGLVADSDHWTWYNACTDAERAYNDLRASGHPPQIARAVLPICLKTEIVMTANFREWRHVLKLRTSPKAHPEMQEIANLIQEELRRQAPTCFN